MGRLGNCRESRGGLALSVVVGNSGGLFPVLLAFWDGTRVVELIRPEEARRLYPVTRADHIKEKIERMFAPPVDWWPLSQGHRSCGDDQTRIMWEVITPRQQKEQTIDNLFSGAARNST